MINAIVPVRGGHVVVDDRAPRDPAPAVLLVAGTGCSMDFWRDDLCNTLVTAGLRVIRFDQRDTGMASADPAGAPTYSLPDLVDDAIAVLDATFVDCAHWVGFSQGGWVAEQAAIHHPERVSSLTLVATRPVAHGPNDPDLPEVSEELLAAFAAPAPPPPPGATEAWVEYLVAGERPFASPHAPFDIDDVRAWASVVVSRTRDLEAMLSNHPAAPQGDRWRERLGEIAVPVSVVHGEDDPLFPLANGQAVAREIPGSTLNVIPAMGHELPRRVRPTVAAAIINTVARAQCAPTVPIDNLVGGSHLHTIAGTEVRPSEIHGRGLFATAPVAAGTVLGMLDGQVVDPVLHPEVVDTLEWNAIAPASLLVRPIRTSYGYMNHSERPNVAIDTDGRRIWAHAPIEAGDELTIDYFAQPVPECYLQSDEAQRLRATPTGPVLPIR